MIDTMRIIYDTVSHHDTVFVKGTDYLEIVKKVDDMYSNAWNRLLIFGGVLSVAVPSAIAWFLQYRLRSSDKKFKSRIGKLKIEGFRSHGFAAQMQAEMSKRWNSGKPNHAQIISDYLKAIKYYIKGKDRANISRCLSAIDNWLDGISADERIQIGMQTTIRTDLDVISADLPKTLRLPFEKIRELLNPQPQK